MSASVRSWIARVGGGAAAPVLASGFWIAGLGSAAALPFPPFPGCEQITFADYTYGEIPGKRTTRDPVSGVEYYWKCPPITNIRSFGFRQGVILDPGTSTLFTGVNVGAGFSGVYAVNGLNEFEKAGPATTRMAPTNTSPAATVSLSILSPVNTVLPGLPHGTLFDVVGLFTSFTAMHQETSTRFPDFVPGITATNNIAGGIELGHTFPMTQSMIFTKIGIVSEHHDFFIRTPGPVTFAHANVTGLQTGFGAAWMTPWQGVSVFAEVDENIFGQHTFDGSPASTLSIYKDKRNETRATIGASVNLGTWIDERGVEHQLHTP